MTPLLGFALPGALVYSLLPAVYGQDNPSAYAPTTNVECPSSPLLRTFSTQNQSINALEQDYLNQRDTLVLPQAWQSWLGDGSALGYNVSQFESNWPRIGIAACGGGFRASLYDIGTLSGFDARNDSSKAAGTGGLLQVASYLTGLSGTRFFIPSTSIRFLNVVI